jgi:spore coat polysaccharide biosynthesis protein SpsF
MTTKSHVTPQEAFWAGEFGSEYIGRNDSAAMVATNLNTFRKALKYAKMDIKSALEIGANIGMNLKALQLLYPGIHLKAVEINRDAAKRLVNLIGESNVFEGSIFDYPNHEKVDLAMAKGVLIHINPDKLQGVYEMLYKASRRFILLAEYYNPAPIEITYRGHADRLFKRDFAGEMLDKYPDLRLVDYGFVYHRDPVFPDDDINWFLLEKNEIHTNPFRAP